MSLLLQLGQRSQAAVTAHLAFRIGKRKVLADLPANCPSGSRILFGDELLHSLQIPGFEQRGLDRDWLIHGRIGVH